MESNCNYVDPFKKISDLTNYKDCVVISDYEGQELPSKEKEKYIICGDILDSTVGGSEQPHFKKDNVKIGIHNKDFNIRNMLKIVNNPDKYMLIFGNRDINKLKTGPLTLISSTDSKNDGLVKNFNNGMINLSFKTYETYIKQKANLKWQANIKHWLPFWNGTITPKLFGNSIENEDNFKKWTENENNFTSNNFDIPPIQKPDGTIIEQPPFLTRFRRIFGTDGSEGTMSAGNLLYGIPREVLGQEEYNKVYEKEDYLAFITLAVFRVMCISPDLYTRDIKSYTNNILTTTLNTTDLKGLLVKFYKAKNTNFIGYIDLSNKLILFSHGGVTNKILENNYENQISHFNKETNGKKNIKILTQSGGSIPKSSKEIKNKIECINNFLNLQIENILDQNPEENQKFLIPSQQMLTIMALSAPYIPPDKTDFVNTSPINPGIAILLKDKFFCSDKKLVQILGHIPKGFATGLYKFTQPKNGREGDLYELNIINLDISQSFKYGHMSGKSDNNITISKEDIFINTYIDTIDIPLYNESYTSQTNKKLETEKQKVEKLTEEKDKKQKENIDKEIAKLQENINTKFFNGTKNTELSEIKISGNLTDLLKKITIPSVAGYEFVYHGIYNNNIVYSKLYGHEKQLYLQPLENQQGGNYKEKYLKYKQKYLQLKQSL